MTRSSAQNHGMTVEHDLAGEERFVVLRAGVIDTWNVPRRQHPHHAGNLQRGLGAHFEDPRVRVQCLDGSGVQAIPGTDNKVIGGRRGYGVSGPGPSRIGQASPPAPPVVPAFTSRSLYRSMA